MGTYVRDRKSQWYLIDDTRVEAVRWSSVQEQHAYMLLYSANVPVMPPEPSRTQEPTKAAVTNDGVPAAMIDNSREASLRPSVGNLCESELSKTHPQVQHGWIPDL